MRAFAILCVMLLVGCSGDRNANVPLCPFSPADRGCYGNCSVVVRDVGPLPAPALGAMLPASFCAKACGRACDPTCGEDFCEARDAGDGSSAVTCHRQCLYR